MRETSRICELIVHWDTYIGGTANYVLTYIDITQAQLLIAILNNPKIYKQNMPYITEGMLNNNFTQKDH